MKERRRAVPAAALTHRMNTRIRNGLRGARAGKTWPARLGYGVAELKAHLERQFLPGMGWHNMGRWHIDHIVPLRMFKFADAADLDFKAAWALSNLRPLWREENLRKQGRREHLL